MDVKNFFNSSKFHFGIVGTTKSARIEILNIEIQETSSSSNTICNSHWSHSSAVIIDSNLNLSLTNGNYSFIGDVIISESLQIDNTTFFIEGNLEIQSGLMIKVGSNLGPIFEITSCTNFSGDLSLQIDDSKLGLGETNFTLAKYGCYSGNSFNSLSIALSSHSTRKLCNDGFLNYRSSQLVVIIDLCPTVAEGAESPDGFISGLSLGASVGIVVAASVIFLAILITSILLINPNTRKKILPHRDRAFYRPNQSKE
jgi:hypothetical protein